MVTTTIIPLFIIAYFATVFGNGVMEKLPVGVVDLDNSSTSQSIKRNVNANEKINITHSYNSTYNARAGLINGEIYAFFVIPHNFEQDLKAFKRPAITYYLNMVYMGIDGNIMEGLLTTLETISMSPVLAKGQATGKTAMQLEGILQPINVNEHPLNNTEGNYASYLSPVFIHALIQILILITTFYVVGIELKQRTSRQWLRTANKSMLIAITAKLLPYTALFCFVSIFGNVVLFYIKGIPLAGSMVAINAGTILNVLAYQGFSLFIVGLIPVMRYGISTVSMFGSLGASFCGLTFPIVSMPSAAQPFASYFPIHHYMKVYQLMGQSDYGYQYAWPSYVALMVFVLLPFTVLWKLKREMIYNHLQKDHDIEVNS